MKRDRIALFAELLAIFGVCIAAAFASMIMIG